MPLETGLYISDLDETWPLGGDPTNKGDDHIRFTKLVIKTVFPGSGGQGFSKPITATEDQLNFVTGLTSNAQAQFNALGVRVDSLEASLPAPAGTKLSFYQSAAPAGWTQDTTKSNYTMRVVSTAGGGSGGTDDPVLNNNAHTHTTGSHTLTIAQMPAHDHEGTKRLYVNNDTPQQFQYLSDGSTRTGMTGGGGSHNHGSTGSGGTNWTPKYIDVIIASKDA